MFRATRSQVWMQTFWSECSNSEFHLCLTHFAVLDFHTSFRRKMSEIWFFFHLKTKFHTEAQDGLELTVILLPQLSKNSIRCVCHDDLASDTGWNCMKQSITLERNIVHKSVTHSPAWEAPSTELFSVMKNALSISCKEPCDWRMTYTTDLSPAHCSVKLEHHPRGNTRVEPLTSENMTADSKEEKCLKRTNTAQSQSCEKKLAVWPPVLWRPHKQSGEETKSRDQLAQHSNRYFLRLEKAAQG